MAFLRARRGSLLWVIAIGLVAVVLAVLVSIPLLGPDDAGPEGSLVGRKAPSISADDLAGRHWTLADGDGRVTWVNFWATNCEPCRTEMPAMQRLVDTHGDRPLVLGVAGASLAPRSRTSSSATRSISRSCSTRASTTSTDGRRVRAYRGTTL